MIARAAIVALLLAAAGAGIAAVPCGPYREAAGVLSRNHGESRHSFGLSGGDAFELWINPISRSWTALWRTTSDRACIVAAGTDWSGGGAVGARSVSEAGHVAAGAL